MKKSVTKFEVTLDQIRDCFKAAGITDISDIKELSDGWYNSAYSAADKDGKRYVIKIAPSDAVRVLTHERDLMRSEVRVYRLLSEKTAVKTPKIIYSDFSKSVIPVSYFIMDFLDGERLDKARLTPDERKKADEQWAFILSEFHKIKGVGYGYEQAGLKAAWKDALAHMTQILIDDAAYFGKNCRTGKKLLFYINEFAAELENVPCALVNFDLHPMNMFCKRTKDGGIELTVLDLERCFFGDPVGDMIMHGSMREGLAKKAAVQLYNRFAEEKMGVGRNEQIRYNLLFAYLAVIMYTERFSRFEGFGKYFNSVYWLGTLGYKMIASRSFSALKRFLRETR